MIDKTKAPGCVGAQSGARKESSLAGAVPCSNSTTDGAERQPGGLVFDLLLTGESSAIPARHLEALTGLSSRGLRRAIDREREHGALILANDNGYFKPSPGSAGIRELKVFCRRMDGRALANRRCTAPMRAALKTLQKAPLVGQQTFFGGDYDG